MRKVKETTKGRAMRVNGQLQRCCLSPEVIPLTLRSTEDTIPSSLAMSGKEGAIIDEANGSRNANNPIMIVALLRTLLGHWRGSMATI
jgi:hypothetical protein